MPGETPQLQPIVPGYKLRILSDEQLTQFRSATLEILDEAGVHCPSEKALSIYAEHGAKVNLQSQIVKLPPGVVQEAMSHAPRFYTMGARTPAFGLELDGTAMFCATDGCGTETIDFVSRKRRLPRTGDVAKMTRVADYLSSMGFYSPIMTEHDHPATAPLHEWMPCSETLSSTSNPRR